MYKREKKKIYRLGAFANNMFTVLEMEGEEPEILLSEQEIALGTEIE